MAFAKKRHISVVGAVSVTLIVASAAPLAAQVLVDHGSRVAYLGNPVDPGIDALAWTAPGFDDSNWSEGVFGVGYEIAVDALDVKAGSLLGSFVAEGSISAYARATFVIPNPAEVTSLHLALDYDDAVVAWINGTEVYRSPEMPPGLPAWDTPPLDHESSNGVDPDFSSTVDISTVAIPLLTAGDNVLAIGVWNDTAQSTDLVLVPRLWANVPEAFVVRGPYLQQGSHESVVVRWRTDRNTKSRVWYGLSPEQLDQSMSRNGSRSEHEFRLTGLAPDTTYFYAVGTLNEMLVGGDLEHSFRTAPVPGTRRPVRIWAIGDTGTPNAESAAVRDAFVEFNDGNEPDVWLMLGDNAYDYGTQEEHEGAVFNRYPQLLRRTVLWPCIGNHDAESASASTQNGVYYDIFTLPASAEAGGVSSGTEAYYSFDFANIHFVVLNSEDSSRALDGPMLTWLETDLMSTDQDWIVAYWHSPPYSKGSHDSDDVGSEPEMVEMRERALPILEDWGVDLVLNGHSHNYERSFLLDGHYGHSTSLTPGMALDDGDGSLAGGGAYQKPGQGPGSHEGAIYVVAGNGSEVFDTVSGLHPVMVTSQVRLGSVALDVEGDRIEARMIDDSGTVRDRFTIVKNAASLPQADFSGEPRVGTAPLGVAFTDLSSTNTAAWEWDFDGDGLVDSLLRNPEAIFVEPGLHEVRLTASNLAGTDRETKVDYVCVAATPSSVSGLVLVDPDSLAWDLAVGAASYDVIQGNLGLLLDAGGSFAASGPSCLLANASGSGAVDPEPLQPGQSRYYLVRAVGCADDAGTYDSGGPSQSGPRDESLLSLVCP